MEKSIYIFITIFFLIGAGFLFFIGKQDLSAITVRDSEARTNIAEGTTQGIVSIPTRKRFDLQLDEALASTTWKIDRAHDDYEDFILDTDVLVYSFDDTGTYTIRAFTDMKLTGLREIRVVPGEVVDFKLPYSTIYVGENAQFADASSGAVSRQWNINAADGKQVYSSSDQVLDWTPSVAGSYTLELQVQTASDRTLSKTHEFSVENKPKPVVEKPKPVERPVVVAEKKPTPPPVKVEPTEPKPKTPAKVVTPPPTGTASFIPNFSGSGRTKIGPEAPEKSKVEFKSQPVVFKVTPKVNMRLSQFAFWGNFNTGKYTLRIECTSCEPGSNIVTYDYRTGNDEYSVQVNKLANKLGLIAGRTYEISIVPDKNTEMGFAKPGKMAYGNDFVELEFKSTETSIFDISFLK